MPGIFQIIYLSSLPKDITQRVGVVYMVLIKDLMAPGLGYCCPSIQSELQFHDNVNTDLALREPNDC